MRTMILLALFGLVGCHVGKTEPTRVLILGDSISIGYTHFVRKMLGDEYVVVRPMTSDERAENCEGTTKGVGAIDRWLELDGGGFDVIHFNFGLHDLKAIDPKSGKSSGNPEHPKQADLQTYLVQLAVIVDRLGQTRAKLIFSTTTPVPEGGVKPFRNPNDVIAYNTGAVSLMRSRGIEIDDLYGFALPRLAVLQKPVNVHFTRAGTRLLAEKVTQSIEETVCGK